MRSARKLGFSPSVYIRTGRLSRLAIEWVEPAAGLESTAAFAAKDHRFRLLRKDLKPSETDPASKSLLIQWTFGVFSFKTVLGMTTDEVLDALGRYTRDSKRSHRETATELGIRQTVLWDWLGRKTLPEKSGVARIAGFLKRVRYL